MAGRGLTDRQAVQTRATVGGTARGRSICPVKVVSKQILQCGSSKGKI